MTLLVTWSADWADEFQSEGFKIFAEADYASFLTELLIHSGNLTWYFGTNEGFENEDADFFLDHLTVHKVQDVELTLIRSVFPEAFTTGFGQFPSFDWSDEEE